VDNFWGAAAPESVSLRTTKGRGKFQDTRRESHKKPHPIANVIRPSGIVSESKPTMTGTVIPENIEKYPTALSTFGTFSVIGSFCLLSSVREGKERKNGAGAISRGSRPNTKQIM